jgi:peptidyl-prolyl cis-trans isomerase SurA
MVDLMRFFPKLMILAALGITTLATAQGIKAKPEASKGKLSTTLGTQSLPGAGSAAEESGVDGIVAIVSSDIITRGELNRQLATIERQMVRKGVPLPDRKELQKQVLDRIIMDKAQILQAKEVGIRIDEAQLDQTIDRIAQQNNMTVEDFLAKLREDSITPERFREEVRSELTISRLKEREVDNRVQVSEAEIDAFLTNRAKGDKGNRPEVNWIQFLIKVPQSATGKPLTDAQKKAEQIESALKKGLSVDDILKTNPELTIDGTGQMGWKSFQEVPTLFSEFLSNGAVDGTAVVRSPNGFHVLKVLGRRQSSSAGLDQTPVTQTNARHILIRATPDVSPTEARRRLNFALEQFRAGTDFAVLAKQYSQDGSAAKGGDLGWLYPGDTVPEFERIMNDLRPGQVSGVFESRFGFHVVQVIERRQQAASIDRQRFAARQAIRQNKMQESYQEYLRQLRDRTFVEIRL